MTASEWVGLIGGIIGILVIITSVLMWYIRVAVRDEVGKATKPIQPGYRNGGQSLADVAETVKLIAKKLNLEES